MNWFRKMTCIDCKKSIGFFERLDQWPGGWPICGDCVDKGLKRLGDDLGGV